LKDIVERRPPTVKFPDRPIVTAPLQRRYRFVTATGASCMRGAEKAARKIAMPGRCEPPLSRLNLLQSHTSLARFSAMTADSLTSKASVASAWRRLALDLAGFGVIVLCLEAGEASHRGLGIPIPGNVAGMALLLVLLKTGMVTERLLSRAAGWLLLLLPALFVPLYVVPLADLNFWARYSKTFLPAAIGGAAITISLVGLLAYRIIRR
jgi:holin-like protein